MAYVLQIALHVFVSDFVLVFITIVANELNQIWFQGAFQF